MVFARFPTKIISDNGSSLGLGLRYSGQIMQMVNTRSSVFKLRNKPRFHFVNSGKHQTHCPLLHYLRACQANKRNHLFLRLFTRKNDPLGQIKLKFVPDPQISLLLNAALIKCGKRTNRIPDLKWERVELRGFPGNSIAMLV